MRRRRRSPALIAPLAALLLGLAGCGLTGTGSAQPTAKPPPAQPSIARTSEPTASVAGNATIPPIGSDQPQWKFFVVRHADRAEDGTDDPPLTTKGATRAAHLADLMGTEHGVAVYATRYRRAQSTARPTATAWKVAISTYPGDRQPTDLLADVKAAHPRGAILVVGHSDTVPAVVGELCHCKVDPIAESDFGNLYEVDLGADSSVLKAEQTTDY
jgi:phosphohistidine phosphatase SixA